MSYSNTVAVLDMEGGTLTMPVTARLWMVMADSQQEEGSTDITVKRDDTSPVSFSFTHDGSFANVSRSVGLSVQDTGRVASDTGWLFRSGIYNTDLPTTPIEVVTADRTILPAELSSMLPAVPFTVDPSTTATAITATIAPASTSPPRPGGVDLVITGTTTKGGPSVGFTWTGRVLLMPSSNIPDALSFAIDVGIDSPSITFTPGSNPVSTVTAWILNGVHSVVLNRLGPDMRTKIEWMVNTAIVTAAGKALPGGTLPAGVVLSMRSVSITSAPSIAIRGALGAFGGVLSKLPAPLAAQTAFYRLFSPKTGDHFYTMLLSERDIAVQNGYQDEGVACNVDSQPSGADTPFYKAFSPKTGDHFYTTSTPEFYNAVANLGYQDEGIACYVFAAAGSGLLPFYRAFSPQSGDHFYTTSKPEHDNAVANLGYRDEGIACYVLSP
jgi:hypothetical protein